MRTFSVFCLALALGVILGVLAGQAGWLDRRSPTERALDDYAWQQQRLHLLNNP